MYKRKIKIYVNQIIRDKLVQKESANDKVISKIIYLIENGKYQTKDEIPNNFIKIWDEFSVVDKLLLKQERSALPESLKEERVKIAHERHLGIVRILRGFYVLKFGLRI